MWTDGTSASGLNSVFSFFVLNGEGNFFGNRINDFRLETNRTSLDAFSVEEVEEVITLEEANKSFQNLFTFFESKQAFEDENFLKHFNSIEKKLEVPKNLQASLETYFSFN